MSIAVLVVEDDSDVRETLAEFLELEGFQVRTAGHGREALEVLNDEWLPGLIVLDLMMPVMDGWEFLAAIHDGGPERLRAVPIIIVSAAADLVDLSRRYPCDIMSKPVDIHRLLDKVREAAGFHK